MRQTLFPEMKTGPLMDPVNYTTTLPVKFFKKKPSGGLSNPFSRGIFFAVAPQGSDGT